MAANAPNENSEKREESENNMARFRWNQGGKVSDLIQCLAQYKSTMEYNSDSSADKVKLYEAVTQAISKIYIDKPSFFWSCAYYTFGRG